MRKSPRKRELICPICGITFMGLNHSKTCGALSCGTEFRKRSKKDTWYTRRQTMKTFKLRNGLEVLNNVFGKELANVKFDK